MLSRGRLLEDVVRPQRSKDLGPCEAGRTDTVLLVGVSSQLRTEAVAMCQP